MKFNSFIFCFVLIQIGYALDDSKIGKAILISNNNIKSKILLNQLTNQLISDEPIITTKYGTIHGFKHIIGILPEYGEITTDIFLGIPYAKPPIDDLRFEVIFF